MKIKPLNDRVIVKRLDEEEKTVLRLSLEEGECRQPGKAEYLPLVGRIRLLPGADRLILGQLESPSYRGP